RCAEWHRQGVACQWQDLSMPTGFNIKSKSGDIVVDQIPASQQVLASYIYWAYWAKYSKVAVNEKVYNREVIDRRNAVLFSNAVRKMTSAEHFVIPWGGDHFDSLRQEFE